MKIILSIFLSLYSLFSLGQNGTVRGTVFDDKTGETLVGVAVVVKGTTTGTSTDLDGQFTLNLPAGTYELQVSYISFETMLISSVQVSQGKTTLFENIRLKTSTLAIEEVVVSAEVIRTTESALNTIKRQSASIMDGISASKMKLTGDNSAAEAAKRVTGVSIEDGKYVYVRGLGDRYSKTTLNNVDIPGLDPDRNTLQMDLFPTQLIDNMLVSKNFTADMPADFTGGLMNVETKDFPEEKIMSISVGTSYNPDMHFNKNFLSYKGGSTDFLGFDDGTRKLPAGAELSKIPTPISGHPASEVTNFIRSFNPELAASKQTSLADMSLSFSLGNQIELSPTSNGPKLGYIFSLSWRSDYKFWENQTFGEYQRYIDPTIYEMREATVQTGNVGERNSLVGLLGGLALKTKSYKIRLMAMRLQSGESRAGKFEIFNNGEAVGQSGYNATSDNLEYNQRSLSNVLLNGIHTFNGKGWELDWRLSPTLSGSHDPDIRKTAFTHMPGGSSFMAGAGGNPTRIWRSLTEWNLMGRADITCKYKFRENPAKLKFGVSHGYKTRDYEILFFDIQFFGGQSWPNSDPATVLQPENIFPNRPNSIYYQTGNPDPNPNAYSSNIQNTGMYISNELELFKGMKAIAGLRTENYVQRHTGRDQRYASGDTQNGRNLKNEKVLESLDLFPSLNLIYAVNEKQNFRLSYSRTIARPSFKELSFAQILDPISNRIFNGSLFSYPGWNGQLTETRIQNLDLRWEHFMDRGQIFSVSAFAKTFDRPIELVRIPEQQTSTEYQPRNVGDGRLYGVELEARKDFGFISPSLSNLNVSGNITLVESTIEMTEMEFNSRQTYQKEGEKVSDKRSMAGQSPYVINAGIGYNSHDAGLDAGLFYNVKGSTLVIVGAGLFPDIYSEPFRSLNFSFSKKLGKSKNSSVDLKISNLMDSEVKSVYRSYQAVDQIYSLQNSGRTFSLGFSYQF